MKERIGIGGWRGRAAALARVWALLRWEPPAGVKVFYHLDPTSRGPRIVAFLRCDLAGDSVEVSPWVPWRRARLGLDWVASAVSDERGRAARIDPRLLEELEAEDARHYDACEDILGGDGHDFH